eukprot:6302010-Lingulodinium_polyedra.AAC.1
MPPLASGGSPMRPWALSPRSRPRRFLGPPSSASRSRATGWRGLARSGIASRSLLTPISRVGRSQSSGAAAATRGRWGFPRDARGLAKGRRLCQAPREGAEGGADA